MNLSNVTINHTAEFKREPLLVQWRVRLGNWVLGPFLPLLLGYGGKQAIVTNAEVPFKVVWGAAERYEHIWVTNADIGFEVVKDRPVMSYFGGMK